MRSLAIFIILLMTYVSLMGPFSRYMADKPFSEKAGAVPSATLLKFLTADQKQFTSAAMIFNVLIYFGTLAEKTEKQIRIPPDFDGMYRSLKAAITLDPYNMDGYYFSQAILAWDLKKIDEANALLDEGMKYRTWDWYLPFFAGFNSAYFQKDFKKAAEYYRRAGELSGASLFSSLAGRYLFESGQTKLAIDYLKTMEKSARNSAVRKHFRNRLQALESVRQIELARDQYHNARHAWPESVAILLEDGFLGTMPSDPYGGTFYLNETHQVRSTSNFAFGKNKSIE